MSDPSVHAFADECRKIIRTYMNELTDNVALGSAKTFEEYQRTVGQIEGLAIAERELLNLLNLSSEED
ncbi:MAG: hypothetical protein CMB55_08155 [Euryarchaeota archaeon]|nr:hypothetical protein [Euryarchaeota archaeon]|tara:strand:- start:472 stop:675 length:204 start_codon:yes stop_codon:yes gene_type:complete